MSAELKIETFSYIKIINSYRSVHIVKPKDKAWGCSSLMEPLTGTGKALGLPPALQSTQEKQITNISTLNEILRGPKAS